MGSFKKVPSPEKNKFLASPGSKKESTVCKDKGRKRPQGER
jgi:hypothetical protein